MTHPRLALAPGGTRSWLADAIVAGGGEVVGPEQAEGLVWADTGRADELAALVAAHPAIRWVQLPWAGIEPFAAVLDPGRTWTCGKGCTPCPSPSTPWPWPWPACGAWWAMPGPLSWHGPVGVNLVGAEVAVLGGGGITEALLSLFAPFTVRATVVRATPRPMAGAERVVGPDGLLDAVTGARLVVAALALTPRTRGLIGAEVFVAMADDGWLVNVARGGHVRTDELVAALSAGVIGGAALDVTDPEPLPDDHPLWALPNCLITPHVGNTPEMAVPLLAERIRENTRRFGAGEPLLGLVDPAAGY